MRPILKFPPVAPARLAALPSFAAFPILAVLVVLAIPAARPAAASGPSSAPDDAQSSPPPTQSLRDQIQSVILERHPTDTADWWRGLGSQAPAVIMSMYQDSSHVYQRLRLVEGLGWFDDSSVTDFLKEQAQGATDDLIRDASITSIGISQGAREEDFIAGFLQSDDPQTRLAAAVALKRIGDPRSREILANYLSTEKIGWLRDKVIHQPIHPPVAPLRIATHQERRLNAAFGGHWTGFWVEPITGSRPASEMKSDPVTLDLALRNGTDLSGELRIARSSVASAAASGSAAVTTAASPTASVARASVTYRLDRIVGKDGRISGVFSRADAGKEKAAGHRKVAFDGELVQKDGVTVLHFVMPETLGTMMVLREPSR